MVDFVISLVVMPTLLSLVKPETGEAPHERYLLPPLHARGARGRRGIRRGSSPSALAIGVRGGRSGSSGCASTPTTSTSSAGIIRSASRPPSSTTKLAGVYSFQMMLEGPPDSLKRPDMLARMDQLQKRAAARAARPQGHVGRRLREAHPPRAERRPRRRRTSSRPTPTPSRRSCSSSRSAAKAATSSSASSPATSRARRSRSSSQSMSSDLVLEQVEQADALREGDLRGHRHLRRSRPARAGCSARSTTTW